MFPGDLVPEPLRTVKLKFVEHHPLGSRWIGSRVPANNPGGTSTSGPDPAPRLIVPRVFEAPHLPADERLRDLRGPLKEVTVAHDGVALGVFRVRGELEVLHPGAEPHTGYPAHPDEHSYLTVLGYGSLELLGDGPDLLLGHLARNLPTQHVARALVQPSDHGHLPLVDSRHYVFRGQVQSIRGV